MNRPISWPATVIWIAVLATLNHVIWQICR